MDKTGQWHFKCPECDYDDKEAGRLATDDEIYCALCFSDCLHKVLLKRWPATGEENAEASDQDHS